MEKMLAERNPVGGGGGDRSAEFGTCGSARWRPGSSRRDASWHAPRGGRRFEKAQTTTLATNWSRAHEVHFSSRQRSFLGRARTGIRSGRCRLLSRDIIVGQVRRAGKNELQKKRMVTWGRATIAVWKRLGLTSRPPHHGG